jgi:hypothetical protein
MERREKSPDEKPGEEKSRPELDLPRELRPFVDEDGKLAQWPAKQKTQRMAAAYLASRFEPGRNYNEAEVNELLNQWHTFEDWALLRRVLFDWKYLDRESDCSRYWLRTDRPARPGQASDPATTSSA